jgi:hypothetical protein
MPAPTLVSTVPATGATNVAKNTSIQALFSTALATSTVSPKTVLLKNMLLGGELVNTSVTLSTDGLTITILPVELLVPNCTYQVVFVGNDVSATSRITAVDTSALAITQKISFQTGTALQTNTNTGLKTETDRNLEGDLLLPDDIGFRATDAPLRLLRTSPAHHAFGIPTTTQRLRFQFSRAVDAATLTDNVEVTFDTFYGQDDYLATYVNIGEDEGPRHYFQYETGTYIGGEVPYLNPTLFIEPTWTATVSGEYLDINLTPFTGDLNYNMTIQVDLLDNLADIDGNPISESMSYMVSTQPYPNWATVTQVRHEVGAFASTATPDDFIGLRIWQATIDVWEQLYNSINLVTPTQYHRMYVRVRAALDTFDDLMALKYINSGVVKELGDLRIQYNTGAGGARPRRVKELEERLKLLYHNVFGGWTQAPRTGIRGEWDCLEPGRGYFRDRLWRAEIMQNKNEYGLTGRIAANTAYTRRQGVLGSGGTWAVWWQ